MMIWKSRMSMVSDIYLEPKKHRMKSRPKISTVVALKYFTDSEELRSD